MFGRWRYFREEGFAERGVSRLRGGGQLEGRGFWLPFFLERELES